MVRLDIAGLVEKFKQPEVAREFVRILLASANRRQQDTGSA